MMIKIRFHLKIKIRTLMKSRQHIAELSDVIEVLH